MAVETPTFYQGVHRTQYDGSPKANENCTPTAGANGARASTGGRIDLSGAQVRSRVLVREETSPAIKGWSLKDLDLAMERIGVPFVIGTGGWDGVRRARAERKAIVLQGDSEEFPNGTCSGVFDGDHAVEIHPDVNGSLWLLADGICRSRRWETEAVLHRYATNFRASISFGVFPTPVPFVKPPAVVSSLGWVRVDGAFWPYTVRGNPTTGYDDTTRPATPKVTKGFSANVGLVVPTHWKGRDREFGKIVDPDSAFNGLWVDLLDEPNVQYHAAT